MSSYPQTSPKPIFESGRYGNALCTLLSGFLIPVSLNGPHSPLSRPDRIPSMAKKHCQQYNSAAITTPAITPRACHRRILRLHEFR